MDLQKLKSQVSQEAENSLVYESNYVRAFITHGTDCSESFYSPKKDDIIPATITFDKKNKTIQISFISDELAQGISGNILAKQLWGHQAWNYYPDKEHNIGDSPKGQEMTMADFIKAQDAVEVSLEVRSMLANIMKNIEENIKNLSPESIALAITHNGDNSWWRSPVFTAFEENMTTSLEKDGYNLSCYCVCDNTIGDDMPINPHTDIYGIWARIEKPDEYQIQASYDFNDDEKKLFADLCIDRQKYFNENELSELNQNEPTIDD